MVFPPCCLRSGPVRPLGAEDQINLIVFNRSSVAPSLVLSALSAVFAGNAASGLPYQKGLNVRASRRGLEVIGFGEAKCPVMMKQKPKLKAARLPLRGRRVVVNEKTKETNI